ncbi:MAG: hypothetical protein ACK48P_06175, partial [Holosporales bacterium]
YNPEVIRNCPVVVEPIHTHSFQNQWNRGYYIEVMPYLSPLEKDKEEDRKAFERVRKTLRRYQIEDNDFSIDGVGRWNDGTIAVFDRTAMKFNPDIDPDSDNDDWLAKLQAVIAKSKEG